MSRQGWLLSSPQWFVLMVAVTYVGGVAGCRPAPTPPAAVDEHDLGEHDHEDHDGDDHDHDGHDHAGHDHDGDIDVSSLAPIKSAPPLESLSQGIDQLVVLRDAIAQGYADDDVESIHDHLHGVADVLGQIEDMIPDTKVPDDTKKKMEQAVETLFNAYGELDAKQHGNEGKNYDEVSEEINRAVDTLTQNSPS